MELFDDWTAEERLALEPRRAKANAARALSAGVVFDRMTGFDPPIVNVHCYTDVQYRWVQVVFEDTIGPDVALRLGERLAAVAGEDNVYFNSLRPRAVYFLLEPSLDGQVDIPASQYGSRLAEIRACWSGGAANGAARGRERPRGGTSRRVAARRGDPRSDDTSRTRGRSPASHR